MESVENEHDLTLPPQPLRLHDRQQLVGGAAGALVAALPFADEVGRDVEVGGEHALVDAGAVADGADLVGCQIRHLRQA